MTDNDKEIYSITGDQIAWGAIRLCLNIFKYMVVFPISLGLGVNHGLRLFFRDHPEILLNLYKK